MTGADRVFLTATDIPNGEVGLVRVLERAIGGHDACVIRRQSGDLEPLFALYTRGCQEQVENCLRGERRPARMA